MTPPAEPRRQSTLEYIHCPWGELIVGTKADLEGLGIARGQALPGEAGGPRRTLHVLDPRGLPAEIEKTRHEEPGSYTVRIAFPDREGYPFHGLPEGLANGVELIRRPFWDEYRGLADALASLQLARPEHFPGQPGMRKMSVSVSPDGEVFAGPPTANPPAKFSCKGACNIRRAGRTKFSIRVYVAPEEAELRWAARRTKDREYEGRMAMLSRPAPLVPLRQLPTRGQRPTHLRLVWSAP